MKFAIRRCLFVLLFVVMLTTIQAQSVAINDDGSLPHPSAILDLKVAAATKKGALLPRMTGPQRAAIPTPAKGLLVYDSTSNSFWFHNGTAWTELSKGINPWTVNGTNVYNLPGNIGIGVSTPKARLNVFKNQNVLFGESMSGVGTKFIWNGTKGALRAGLTEISYPIESPPFPWDDSQLGDASFATGINTLASGYGSAAFGQQTSAANNYTIAGGTWSIASGWNSFAFGFVSDASGSEAFAVGDQVEASGDASAAVNSLNLSSGSASFTAGSDNTSSGISSATFGTHNFNTSASGFVIGQYNDSITNRTNGQAATAPLFTIGNGAGLGPRKNALVVLRNGYTGINKNPGSVAINDGLLQLKQVGTRHLLTLEAATTTNKWSFSMTPNLVLYYNNALRGTFNATSGAYVAASDARLKKDIHSMQPVLQDIMQLKTYTYHLLDNESSDQLSYGLMAHELQQVFPDLVSKLDPEDSQSLLGINYSNLSVLSIKSIQELKTIIENQNTVIDKLTNEHQQLLLKLEQQEARLREIERVMEKHMED